MLNSSWLPKVMYFNCVHFNIQVLYVCYNIKLAICIGKQAEVSFDYDLSGEGSTFVDGPYQRIGFSSHRQDEWVRLINEGGNDIVYVMSANVTFRYLLILYFNII